jgi:hypothetical protein
MAEKFLAVISGDVYLKIATTHAKIRVTPKIAP